MFRTISPRRLSAPRSLLAFSSPRSFKSHVKLQLKALSPQFYIQPQLYNRRLELVSRSFSTTTLRLINDAQRKTKLKEERKNALQQKLESDPENVTTTSSMTPILDPKPKKTAAAHSGSTDDPDMLRGLRSDLVGLLIPWTLIRRGH